jgi:hypothetical protein
MEKTTQTGGRGIGAPPVGRQRRISVKRKKKIGVRLDRGRPSHGSCVYIDPINGDVYSVENDIGDVIVTFSHDATGAVEPVRKLR